MKPSRHLATAALAAALSLAAALPLVAQEVGLQLYSLRAQLAADLDAGLDSIAAWGIHVVEDGNDGTYGLPFDAYKAKLSERGIAVVSVSAPFEELRDSAAQVLARANAYGAEYAVCFWIPHGTDTLLAPATADSALAVFNAAGAVLAAGGVTLLYHPHGYEFAPHPAGGTVLDALVRGSDHFDFELDLYWIAYPGEDPVAWLRKYPAEWRLVHLKDCRRGVPHGLPHDADVETNVVLGAGQYDVGAVVREARAMGIPYLFIEDESSRVEAQVPGSLKFVRGVLGG